MFYPAGPAPARLQYLTRFSSQLDLSTKTESFKDFVFGEETAEGHLVNKPYGLALFQGAIFVVDTRNAGYAVFDLAKGTTRVVQNSGRGAMKKPINITIDADGTRYVTDTLREQVLVFDRQDKFVRAIGQPGQFKPVDIAIAGERLFVSDIAHHQIHVLDKHSAEILLSFGGRGDKPGQLFQPTNLALGPDQTLYVTDTGNFRVQQFTLDGELVRDIGQIGTVAGKFARPKGIAVDHESRLYVVDSAFENIQILAPDGAPLLFFGQPGSDKSNINMPTVVKVDYANVDYFRKYADPQFDLEYLVLVASQFGLNKVVVFGFGSMRDKDGFHGPPPENKNGRQ